MSLNNISKAFVGKKTFIRSLQNFNSPPNVIASIIIHMKMKPREWERVAEKSKSVFLIYCELQKFIIILKEAKKETINENRLF